MGSQLDVLPLLTVEQPSAHKLPAVLPLTQLLAKFVTQEKVLPLPLLVLLLSLPTVVNAGTSTVAYTTDKNCRQLGSVVTTQCVECWDGYYWNTTMCKLFSKVFVAGFMVFIGMFIN